METADASVKPAFQGIPIPSLWKDKNPESQFAEDDGIDGDIRLMSAKPRHDTRVGRWCCRLAEECWRRPGTSQRIRRLGVDAHEEVLLQASEQPVNGALVLPSRTPD